jgi:hypothetical protein
MQAPVELGFAVVFMVDSLLHIAPLSAWTFSMQVGEETAFLFFSPLHSHAPHCETQSPTLAVCSGETDIPDLCFAETFVQHNQE